MDPVKLYISDERGGGGGGGGGEEYVPQNSITFLNFINEKLKDYKSTNEVTKSSSAKKNSMVGDDGDVGEDDDERRVSSVVDDVEFFRQQKLVGDYINDKTDYRGILIYWGLGVGKTGAAVRIAEGMKSRQVIWLLPSKGLIPGTYDQISMFGDASYRKSKNYAKLSVTEQERENAEIVAKISKRYKLLTYNSVKIIHRIFQLYSQDEAISAEKLLSIKKIEAFKNPLDDKLLIIDEVHNLLRQMIAEGSKTGSTLFHMIMEAKNLKIVALSGTPIADDPFNLAALFNMLRGYMKIGKEKFTAFPKDYDQFRQYFVDVDNNTIKNEKIFAERIAGLVSFYNGIYDESSELFPQTKVHIIKCPMSSYQQSGYNEVRAKEISADRKSKKMKGQIIKKDWKKPGRTSVMSSYRANSRQRANFVFPPYVERPKNLHMLKAEKKATLIREALHALKPEDISPTGNLKKYSRKFYEVVKRIDESPGPVVVYSGFVEIEGINILAKILHTMGYRYYKANAKPDEEIQVVDKDEGDEEVETPIEDTKTPTEPSKKSSKPSKGGEKFVPKFAHFTGKTRLRHKEILDLYNHPDNSHGELLKVLFINVVGIEGLNLKATRQVHYVDEYWFENRFLQVKGRAVRSGSHIHLPKDERHVDIYRYHSVAENPNDMLAVLNETETTDEYLYNLAQKREKLFNKFLDVLKYAAFDCELNWEHNKAAMSHKCMKCVSTPALAEKRKMYAEDIKLHMAPGSDFGCIPLKQRQLKKFIHNSETYYVDEETKKIYQIVKDSKTAIEVGFMDENNNPILG